MKTTNTKKDKHKERELQKFKQTEQVKGGVLHRNPTPSGTYFAGYCVGLPRNCE